ncbi:hypothetical protein [Streptomyces sp. NPDC053427]|uniref:hypothetical protein n=1 Tax=Streptomyces sp. NPDC053427 TaxID=3365701 RepID=UPI0037D64F68
MARATRRSRLLAVVVGRADGDGDGARMVTRPDHGTMIAPGKVARMIRTALWHGRRPQRRGPELISRDDEEGGRAL